MLLKEEIKNGKGTSNLMEFAEWTKLYLKPYWNAVIAIK